MEKRNRDDLTTGPIIKKLIIFFIPIAAGTLFQQLYNAVDALVVSKYIGTVALAAVGGSPSVVSNLAIGFCSALCAGAAVVVAHLFGAKDTECIPAAIQISYIFSILLGLVIGAAVYVFTPQILTALKTPADTFADAATYLRIYFSGFVFVMIYNMGSSILRAVGNSRFPFLCLCVSCGLNIVLDVLFVVAFSMGVKGVALATLIAMVVSALMVTIKLLIQKGECRLILNLPHARIHWSLLKDMLAIGVPSGLQSSMYGISNMILQIGVNTLNTVVVASWTMTGKVDGAYWAVASAFGTAITTFIGQNYGANKMDRVKQAAKKSLLLFLGITVVMSIMLLLAARPLLLLFTEDQQVITLTQELVLYFVPFYFLWTFIETYNGVLRGVGDTLGPTIIEALGICVFRIAWLYTLFRYIPTIRCLSLCYPASWLVTDLVLIYYYKRKSLVARQKII